MKTIKRWFWAMMEAQEQAGMARAQMILKRYGHNQLASWE